MRRQLRITNHRRQNIVKVVGHSPGQPAHSLHFLHLTQLFSQALAFHHLCLQLLQRRGEFCRTLLHPLFQGLVG